MKALHFILVAAVIATSCNHAADQTAEVGNASIEMYKEKMALADSAVSVGLNAPPPPPSPATVQSGEKAPVPTLNRQIIRTARLEMQCKDFKSFNAVVFQRVKQFGGWVYAEQETQSDYQRQNVMEIRVPVDKFDDLVQSIGGLDGKLLVKNISSEDVTNAIIDTKGRIEAKKQVRARYLELLSQAKKMEDILQVQSEINSITEELESASYNAANMQAQAAFSTIYFTFTQPVEGYVPADEPGVLQQLWKAVGNGAEGIWLLVLGMVNIWPLLLVIAGAVYWWRKRKPLAKAAA